MKITLKMNIYFILVTLFIPILPVKASWYSINNDVEGYVKTAALLGATSGAIYATIQWLTVMTPAKAKKTLDYLREHYDVQKCDDQNRIIKFCRIWGNLIEKDFWADYNVPLHRVAIVFSEKIEILDKIIPYLEESDKKDAIILLENFIYYLTIIVYCDEYHNETQKINSTTKDIPLIVILNHS